MFLQTPTCLPTEAELPAISLSLFYDCQNVNTNKCQVSIILATSPFGAYINKHWRMHIFYDPKEKQGNAGTLNRQLFDFALQ